MSRKQPHGLPVSISKGLRIALDYRLLNTSCGPITVAFAWDALEGHGSETLCFATVLHVFSRQFTQGLAHISMVYAVGLKLPLVSAIVGLSSRVLLWGMSLQAVKKMRLCGTQAAPAHDIISGAALAAIMDEG